MIWISLQPAKYVTQLITETGVHLPTYVVEVILETYGSLDG